MRNTLYRSHNKTKITESHYGSGRTVMVSPQVTNRLIDLVNANMDQFMNVSMPYVDPVDTTAYTTTILDGSAGPLEIDSNTTTRGRLTHTSIPHGTRTILDPTGYFSGV